MTRTREENARDLQLEEDTATKKHPDTKQGAIDYLREESTLDLSGDIHGKPDSSVEGVWMLWNHEKSWTAIVYLAGYKDPFGHIRESNDFEEVSSD